MFIVCLFFNRDPIVFLGSILEGWLFLNKISMVFIMGSLSRSHFRKRLKTKDPKKLSREDPCLNDHFL